MKDAKKARKIICLTACICALSLTTALTSCSESIRGDSSKASKKDTGSASSESSDKDRITELEDKVEKLSKVIAGEYGIDGDTTSWDDYDFGEVHDVYDDTAVIEAYKSGDDSKLTDDKDKFILKSLKEAISSIITDDMDDYSKEKAVYDYIFANTTYDDGELAAISSGQDFSHTPYGFFKDHTTICVGNATTFKLFMDALGIDCKIIHCTAEVEHAWDVVNIDGDWYHVDLTFDNGSDGNPDYARFNVNDDIKMDDGYDWSNQDDIPECTSLKYCYLAKNAKEISDVYQIPSELENGFKDGNTSLNFKMKLPENVDEDSAQYELSSIFDGVSSKNNNEYLSCTSAFCSDGYLYFGVTKESYDDSEFVSDDNALDIDINKLSEAFDKVDGITFDPDSVSYMS